MIEKIKKYPDEVALLIILLIGTVFRFYHLGYTSLSNDELSALVRTRFSTFGELIDKGVAVDGHPALVQVLLFYWTKIFGNGVFAIRFPFAIAGIVSILFVYLVGKKWFSKTSGLFAAAAFSTLEFPLLYSQTARPYIFSVLFSLMAVYFWTIILFENFTEENKRKRNRPLAAYVFAMSACMYTHYFSFLFAAIVGLTGLFFMTKENRKEYLLSGIIILLLFLPHLSIFFKQLKIGGVGLWLGKPDENFFRNFISYSLNDSNLLYYLFFGICISSFVYFRKTLAITRYHWLSIGWFLVLFFVGYYYSVLKNPVLQTSTLLPGFPFLILFIFSFIPKESFNKKIIFTSLLGFTLICGYSTVKEKHFFWTNHFGVFKEIAADALNWSDKYGAEKMVKVISVCNPAYINYYFDQMGKKIKIDAYKADEEADLANIMGIIDTTSAIYFIYGWTNIGHPFEVEQTILNTFPHVVERDTFFNSEITLYKRDEKVVKHVTQIPSFTDFENNNWGEEEKIRTEELAHSGKYSEKMDDQHEYGISYTKRLAEFLSLGNAMATASVWINSKDTSDESKLVLSFESEGKAFEWYSASIKSFNRKPGEWQHVLISRPLPKMKAGDDVIKAYVWNPGKKVFYIDDFEVKVEPVRK